MKTKKDLYELLNDIHDQLHKKKVIITEKIDRPDIEHEIHLSQVAGSPLDL